MPELPEVETIKKQLKTSLVGKKIKAVLVFMDKMVFYGPGKISNIKKGSKPRSKKFSQALIGSKILDVQRRAKYLIIELSGKQYLVIHLRMSGQLIYIPKEELKKPIALSLAKTALKETLPSKHTHVEFVFSNGDKLFYNDTRQFGHIRLVNQQGLADVFKQSALGPEPLEMSETQFMEIVRSRPEKRAKDFLLDQTAIAGIGNIYADEALFLSGIRPVRKMRTLSKLEQQLLFASMQKVLKRAIKLGGSSIEYFLMTNGSSGKFADEHLVYAKSGQPCPNCGEPLKSQKIGGRTSTFCPHCQH